MEGNVAEAVDASVDLLPDSEPLNEPMPPDPETPPPAAPASETPPSGSDLAATAEEEGSTGSPSLPLSPEAPEPPDQEDPPVHEGIGQAPPADEERVLVVLPVAATSRLVRETLQSFTTARVESTPDPVRGFEMALQRPYRLFIFGMSFAELSGPLLYELVAKAYTANSMPNRLAPGVVFVRERKDPQLPKEYAGDVRVKAVVNKPIRIDRLLSAVGASIEVRDPTKAAL